MIGGSYPRWLASRCLQIYQDEGVTPLLRKGTAYTALEARRVSSKLPLVDDYALRESRRRLERQKQREDSLSDILHTAYTYRGVGNYRSLKPTQRQRAFEAVLRELPADGITSVLEIGTALGGSLYVWTRYFDADVVSVDINFMDREPFLRSIGDGIRLIEGSSHSEDIREQVARATPEGGFDLVFIDGDHSYDGAKQDFNDYGPLAADDGVVIFDDIHTPFGVSTLWSELRADFDHEEAPVGDPLFGILNPE